MSNYHPLDVRHPSNRRFANPNYLLEAPIAPISSATPSRAPAALQSRSDIANTVAAQAASAAQIWGRARANTAAAQTSTSTQRSGGFFRVGFWLLVFGAVVVWQNGGLAGFEVMARSFARDLGIPWPF